MRVKLALMRRDNFLAAIEGQLAALTNRGINPGGQGLPARGVHRQRRLEQRVMGFRGELFDGGAQRLGVASDLSQIALLRQQCVETLLDQLVRSLVPAAQARQQCLPRRRILNPRMQPPGAGAWSDPPRRAA